MVACVVFTFDDGYENMFNVAYPIMKKYGLVGTVFVITDLVAPKDWRGKKTMTWEQLTELYKNGWDIGSHTASHPWLMKISLKQVVNELKRSKVTLENHGFNVAGIGYAAGDPGDTEPKREAVKNITVGEERLLAKLCLWTIQLIGIGYQAYVF